MFFLSPFSYFTVVMIDMMRMKEEKGEREEIETGKHALYCCEAPVYFFFYTFALHIGLYNLTFEAV